MTRHLISPRSLAFLLSEASGSRSRSIVTVANGSGKLAAGTVIGKVAETGEHVASLAVETAGKEGAEIATGILAYAVDATDQAVEATAIDFDAEIATAMLSFDASVNDQTKIDAKIAQLAAIGIRAR